MSITLYTLFNTLTSSITIQNNSIIASENASSVNTTHINNLIADYGSTISPIIDSLLNTKIVTNNDAFKLGEIKRDDEVTVLKDLLDHASRQIIKLNMTLSNIYYRSFIQTYTYTFYEIRFATPEICYWGVCIPGSPRVRIFSASGPQTATFRFYEFHNDPLHIYSV